MDSDRKLVYGFLSLPYLVRLEIALQLDLMKDEEKGVQQTELYNRIFNRAVEEKKLDQLREAIKENRLKYKLLGDPQ